MFTSCYKKPEYLSVTTMSVYRLAYMMMSSRFRRQMEDVEGGSVWSVSSQLCGQRWMERSGEDDISRYSSVRNPHKAVSQSELINPRVKVHLAETTSNT